MRSAIVLGCQLSLVTAACGSNELTNVELGELQMALDNNVSADELARMKAYLADRIDPASIVGSLTNGDDTFDCIPFDLQPSVKKLTAAGLNIDPELVAPRQSKTNNNVARIDFAEALPAPGEPPLTAGLSLQESCPGGSVPLPRVTLDEIVAAGSLEAHLSGVRAVMPPPSGITQPEPHEHAAVRLSGYTQYGAAAILNLWSPAVSDSGGHISISQIWVSTFNEFAPAQTVEAGWRAMKNQSSRLFVYFTSNGYQNPGNESCFNTDCGFVQTASGAFLNNTWANYSVSGGTQWEAEFVLLKDEFDGHWWFQYQGTWVGYWPRDLFSESGIFNNARQIDFGGEVSYPASLAQHTHTNMGGDGQFASSSSRYQHAAYIKNLRRLQMNFSTGNLFYEAAGTSLVTPQRPTCYNNFKTVYASPWFESMYHGGPGFHQVGPSAGHCTTPSSP